MTPRAIVAELFAARFEALVRDMGELLERTALSTNVKERRDFSCGLLGPTAELVVNAPHIPVHLGALGPCLRAVEADLPLGPGDVAVTNSPAHGGSHLPDITVLTPVFFGGQRLGTLASRAHHAEIGGSRPGSMPPDARCLEEEGVVIRPRLLVAGGRPRFDELARDLAAGRFPSRAIPENLADLAAAVAGNARGAERLLALASIHGAETVREQMALLAGRAADRLTAALRRLGDGRYAAEDRLDDGTPIRVTITVSDGRARIDFGGSGPVHPGNLNATPAIVRSAVLYALRLLVDEPELPLNEGLLGPVELVIPPGVLNPPFVADPARSPAVVGGNTETSQRVVEVLVAALGLAAGSQGTMNNLIFGDASFGYYETICGGCGATPEGPGASAVHSHMTNTRITDPEILELRYPVRLRRFEVREGSGGAGHFRGGDGVRRELEFLAPVSLSLVTQGRVVGPRGAAGGAAGAPGRQWLERADGTREPLGSVAGAELVAGDRVIVETPGGGGWGPERGEGDPR
ncbi:MAG: hydantoinase B/oxoprolinase family protein [Thermoanaerobaculia bacterium]|nr:hydantoinase B/oxoprolinase family protein [Thermoanaerobaculia bacterium]